MAKPKEITHEEWLKLKDEFVSYELQEDDDVNRPVQLMVACIADQATLRQAFHSAQKFFCDITEPRLNSLMYMML